MRELAKRGGKRLWRYLCWSAIAAGTGLAVGGAAAGFGLLLRWAAGYRQTHPHILYFLPLSGLIIAWMYHRFSPGDKGTDSVITTLHGNEEPRARMAPMIFIATILTHLFGGSAGREGAALQLGGSLGGILGRAARLDERRRRVLILCGMSAGFAGVFGTPIASAIFTIEVASVGVMQYAALVPCAVSALTASALSDHLGLHPHRFTLSDVPSFGIESGLKVFMIAVACAALSAFFCWLLHQSSAVYQKLLPNPFLRIAAGGALVCALALLLGTRDYLGAGSEVIVRAVDGAARPEAFALKMVFTALTLGAGYKGGEIVPSLYVGATCGCTMGLWLGISPSLCAAVGLTALFCGVTNCPITALIIGIELFGESAAGYMLLAVAVSFALSGTGGLFGAQKFAYEKDRVHFAESLKN